MTDLLEKAFREAAKLSPDEQDRLASIILAELESEKRWDETFTDSQELLAKLAKEAEAEYEAGRTDPLVSDES